jgi:hypothetical protein
VFRYRLHSRGGDDLGEATYAMIEAIHLAADQGFRVIDVIPLDVEDESPFVGLLQVEALLQMPPPSRSSGWVDGPLFLRGPFPLSTRRGASACGNQHDYEHDEEPPRDRQRAVVPGHDVPHARDRTESPDDCKRTANERREIGKHETSRPSFRQMRSPC